MNSCPATGQSLCYDTAGRPRPCGGTGEDGEYRAGVPWPSPRFEAAAETVLDRLTGLTWSRNANPGGFPLTWDEAFAYIRELNAAAAFGHADWRLPNRRELRSLMDYQAHRPALPAGHPFEELFAGWYWSSTTAAIAPAHAWYLNLAGARLFYGGKDQSFLVWPVRGEGNGLLAATGQTRCYDAAGRPRPCAGSGQDGALRCGRAWPRERFAVRGGEIEDRLTGLTWWRDGDPGGGPLSWQEALETAARLRRAQGRPWRLANVNELESLVDAGRAAPALAAPFDALREGYWAATTSVYEPDWAWALYTAKGAIGVGQKRDPHFHTLLVR